MRVARHQRAPVVFDSLRQHADQLDQRTVDPLQATLEPQPYVRRHLIVPGPRGVQLLAEIAELLDQSCLDRHVDVLVAVVRLPVARMQLLPDRV
jgi:hypothetical protein